MKDNILDSELKEVETNSIKEAVKWWENKRIAFNLLLIVFEIIMVLFFWQGTLNLGFFYLFLFWFLYTIAANVCFSIGWGVEVLSLFYKLKFAKILKEVRLVLYIGGIILSIFLTISIYKDTLYYYQIQYNFLQH